MRAAVVFSLLLITTFSFAQDLQLDFGKGFNPGIVTDSHVDQYGNYYITGYYFAVNNFNTNGGNYQLGLEGLSSQDAFIAKYDNNGYLSWVRPMVGYGSEVPAKIITDDELNVFVTGSFSGGYVIFGQGTANEVSFSDGGYLSNGFLAQYNQDGEFIWATPHADGATLGVAVDNQGSVFTTGTSVNRAYVTKYSVGNSLPVWENNLGTGFAPNSSTGVGIFVSGGVVIITGAYSGQLQVSDQQIFNAVGGRDIFLTHYMVIDGAYAGGARTFGGFGDEFLTDSQVKDGNIYLLGQYQQTINFEDGSGFTAVGSNDGFVVKYTSGPNFAWAKSFGGVGNDEPQEIAINSNNQIFISGSFTGFVDLDPDPVAVAPFNSAGSTDAFLLKLGVNGQYREALTTGGIGDDYGDAVAIDNVGRIFVAGEAADATTTDFDPSQAFYPIFSGKYFMLKFDERPVITEVSVSSGAVGKQITISGRNFGSNELPPVVKFGAVQATNFSVSQNEILAQIPLGATHDEITVTRNRRSTSSALNFAPTYQGQEILTANTFSSTNITTFLAGANPYKNAIADFDQNGMPDIVTVNQGDNTVSVFANSSTKETVLLSKENFSGFNMPRGVATGDLDGDGLTDLIVSNTGSNTLAVFRNISSVGIVQFEPVFTVGVGTGSGPQFLIVADFDNDGKHDIITANTTTSSISVLTNTTEHGSSSISFSVVEAYVSALSLNSILDLEAADFDNDGLVDVAFASPNDNVLTVLKNSTIAGSPLSLNPQLFLTLPIGTSEIASADLNHDGFTDLIASSNSGQLVHVFENTSSGGPLSFNSGFPLLTGRPNNSLALADINGDSKVDIVVVNDFGNVSIFQNVGTSPLAASSFNMIEFGGLGFTGSGIQVADINLDQRPDLIIADNNSNVHVMLNQTSLVPYVSNFYPKEARAGEVITLIGGNFDTDLLNNIVFFGATKANVQGLNATQMQVEIPTGATLGPISVTVNGLTGYSNAHFTPTFDFSGELDASFSVPVEWIPLTPAEQTRRSVVTDINNDGKSDIIVPSPGSKGIDDLLIYLNNAQVGSINETSFTEIVLTQGGSTPYQIAAGDLNGDGKQDLAIANFDDSSPGITIIENQTTSNVVLQPHFYPFGIGIKPTFVAIHDLNNDGLPEVISANDHGASGSIAILRNQGDFSTFQEINFPLPGAVWSIAVGDMDKDGKPDLVVPCSDGRIRVYLNTSSSDLSFALPYEIMTTGSPTIVEIADLDENGLLDIVSGSSTGDNVFLIRNTTQDEGAFEFTGPFNITALKPWSVELADINGDGKAEILASAIPGDQVMIFKNIAPPNMANLALWFQAEGSIYSAGNPLSISSSDFDGDGRTDLAITSESLNKLQVYRNLNTSAQPSTQPNTFVFSEVTSDGLIGTFNPTANTDGYIILRKAGPIVDDMPQDGVAYPVGFQLPNGSLVVYSGSQQFFNASGLGNSATHTFAAFSFNGKYNAVNYLEENPLTETVQTGSGSHYQPNYFQWAAQIGGELGSGSEAVGEVALDADGSVYVVGSFFQATDFDPGAGVTTVTKTTSGADAYLAKYNKDGSLAWAKGFSSGDTQHEAGLGVGVDALGNIYVTGRFSNQITFDPVHPLGTLFSSGGVDLFIAKFSADQVFQWAKKIGGSGDDIETYKNGFEVDPVGNVYLAGEFAGTCYFDGLNSRLSNGQLDGFVAKYFSNGDLHWVRKMGGVGEDFNRDLAIDKEGNSYVMGQMSSPEVSIERFDNGYSSLFSNGATDIYVTKYDPNGTVLWTKNAGGPNADYGESITVDNENSVYISGTYNTYADLALKDLSPGQGINYVMADPSGVNQTFIAKYNTDGFIQWAKSFRSNLDTYAGIRVKADNLGNVYMLGNFDGGLNADPNSGAYFLESLGLSDNVLFKFSSNGFLKWAGQLGGTQDNFAGDLDISTSNEVVVTGVFSGTMDSYPGSNSPALTAGGQYDVFLARFGSEDVTYSALPTISSFTPESGPAGTTVTISGSNFSLNPAENIVYFGAVRATVTSAGANTIDVIVPTGTTFEPISVTTKGKTAHALKAFAMTYDAQSIYDKTSFDVPYPINISTDVSGPVKMVVADLFGDGKPDVLVANSENNTISYIKNESSPASLGRSGFSFTTPSSPSNITTGDIDGDGKLDFIVNSLANNTITLFRNTGATFVSTATFSVNGPEETVIADLDLDGKPEIIVANSVNNSIAIFRNIGAPGILTTNSFATRVDIAVNGVPGAIAVRELYDLNKRPEIIVTHKTGDTKVEIINNETTPGTIEISSFSAAIFPVDLPAITDLKIGQLEDSDNFGDMVVSGSNGVEALTVQPGLSITTNTTTVQNIALGNIDGDAKPDLVTSNGELFINTYAGGAFAANSFNRRATFDIFNGVGDVAVVDFDGDGAQDLIFTNTVDHTVYVLRNLSHIKTPSVQTSNISVANITSESAEFTFEKGDGNFQMVIMNTGAEVTELPQDGGVYATSFTYQTGSELSAGSTHKAVALVTMPSNPQVTVGLTPETQYTATIIEMSDADDGDFNTSSLSKFLTSNPETVSFYSLAVEPFGQPVPFTAETYGPFVKLTFLKAQELAADGYILLRGQGSTPDATGVVDGIHPDLFSIPIASTLVAILNDGQLTEFIDQTTGENTTYDYTLIPFAWADGIAATLNYKTTGVLSSASATTGIALTEPTNQPVDFATSDITATSALVRFTDASPSVAGYLMVRSAGAPPTFIPQDETQYPLGDLDLFPGETIVISGTQVSAIESGLSTATTYHYAIYAYNQDDFSIKYLQENPLTGSFQTLIAEPSTASSNIQITSRTSNEFSFTFTQGNGTGQLIVMKKNSDVVDVDPVDQTSYQGSDIFGAGVDIGGFNFVLAAANHDTWTMAGLQPNTQYALKIFEYNDYPSGVLSATTANANYLQSFSATNNPVTFYSLAEEPEAYPIIEAQAVGTEITVQFPSAASTGYNGYLLLRRTGTEPDAQGIIDGTMPLAGTLPNVDTFIAITDDQQESFSETGTPGLTYYYTLIPFRLGDDETTYNYKTDESLNFASAFPASPAVEPGNPTTFVADNITENSILVSFTAAAAEGYLIVRTAAALGTFVPQDGIPYVEGPLSLNEEIVYIGTNTSYQDNGLIEGTEYNYRIFAFNGTGAGINYSEVLAGDATTTASGTVYTEPTAQVSNIIINGRGESTVNFSFTGVTDSKNLIVITHDSNPTALPIDLTSYNANKNFELGATLGTDNFVIGATSERTWDASSLLPASLYRLAVYSYNDAPAAEGFTTAAANFQTTLTGTGNPVTFFTLDTEPSGNPSVFIASAQSSGISLTFSAAQSVSADGFVLIRRSVSSPSTIGIVDGAAVTQDVLQAEVELVAIIDNNLQTTFLDQQPTVSATIYNYMIIPFNWDGVNNETFNYRTISPREAQTISPSLASEPTANPTAIVASSITKSGGLLTITPATPQPAGYIVIRRLEIVPTSAPQDGVTYTQDQPIAFDEFVVFVGDELSFSEFGLAADKTYHYKVFAFNGANEQTNYRTSDPAQGTLVTDGTAPTFVNNTGSEVQIVQGSTATIKAKYTDLTGLNNVSLHYRSIIGGASYTTVPMTFDAGNNNHTVTVAANSIGELGLDYFFTATDQAENASEGSPSFKVKIQIVNDNKGLQIPYASFGGDVSNYRIVSVPLDLAAKSVANVFADELGAYDDSKWRMFRYNGTTTSELNSSTNIDAGKGYWLIVKDNPGTPIFSGPGTTVQASLDQPFSVSLSAGWNQIGNPYNFNLSWQDVADANSGLTNTVTVYNGSFTTANRLDKMQGGFVFANNSTTLMFPVTKNPAVNSGREKGDGRLKNPINSENWELYLDVKQGLLANSISGIGMRTNAVETWDPNDGMSVPRFNDFLELNHNKTAHGYNIAKDVVATNDSHVWNFSIASNLSNETNVTISWDNSYFGTNEKSLVLWDISKQLGIDMREHTQYTFDKQASGNFKIIFGASEFLRENTRVNSLVFHHIVPNPVRDEAAICFTQPHSERVTIEVLDITGKKTHLVYDGELEEGYHEIAYDRERFSNASGVYIVQIKAGQRSVQQRMILK